MTSLLRWSLLLIVPLPLLAQERTASPHGTLTIACATCHRADSWTALQIDRTFDHGRLGFSLTGAHGATTCRACHTSLDFAKTPSDCAACHTDQHRGELGADCARCHTTRTFLDPSIMARNHQVTRFPLTGGHLALECNACHQAGASGRLQFVGTQVDCLSCHRPAYNGAPNHLASQFPTSCEQCHSTATWSSVSAATHPAAPIALTGVHNASRVACAACHTTTPYASVARSCDGCHLPAYTAAKDPDHAGAGFSTTCTSCHDLTPGWTGATYNHPSAPIALSGAHSANLVTCQQCHATTPYASVARTCDGCHHTAYTATANPNHVTAGYSTDCASCHQVVAGWAGATFNHPTAPIAVTGVHSTNLIPCEQCHTTTPYATVKRTCDGCHLPAYTAAKNPDHVAANFPRDCSTCHGLVPGWIGATFNHPTAPIALSGPHSANLVTCAQCHTATPYTAVPRTCDGCHHAEYTATTNPNHVTAGYSTDCASCHQVVAGWAGATFNHPTSPIALTGVHNAALIPCAQCHTTTPYATVSRTCDGCHLPAYTASRDPDHAVANFSKSCDACHGLVAGWTGARFTAHDGSVSQFRIYSGKHLNKWSQCSECHTLGQPYSATPALLCLNCHAKVQTGEHRGKNYTPSDCVRSGCHANGSKP